MIVDFFVNLASGFMTWILSFIPQGDPPAFITGFATVLQSIIAGASGIGSWIPWLFIVGVVGIVFATWLVAALIRFIRWIIGWIPTMGGGS